MTSHWSLHHHVTTMTLSINILIGLKHRISLSITLKKMSYKLLTVVMSVETQLSPGGWEGGTIAAAGTIRVSLHFQSEGFINFAVLGVVFVRTKAGRLAYTDVSADLLEWLSPLGLPCCGITDWRRLAILRSLVLGGWLIFQDVHECSQCKNKVF